MKLSLFLGLMMIFLTLTKFVDNTEAAKLDTSKFHLPTVSDLKQEHIIFREFAVDVGGKCALPLPHRTGAVCLRWKPATEHTFDICK